VDGVGDLDLPGLEREEKLLWWEIVRAREGEAEVRSSIVKPMLLLLFFRPWPLALVELEDEAEDGPAGNAEVVLMRLLDAILRNAGAVGFEGEGGRPAIMPPRGLLRCGVDFIFAGDLGGLRGAERLLGALSVVIALDDPCLAVVAAC